MSVPVIRFPDGYYLTDDNLIVSKKISIASVTPVAFLKKDIL